MKRWHLLCDIAIIVLLVAVLVAQLGRQSNADRVLELELELAEVKGMAAAGRNEAARARNEIRNEIANLRHYLITETSP